MTADLRFLVLSLLGVVAFVGSMPRLRAVLAGFGLWFLADAAGTLL
jgi:hypothetical protein